MTPERRPSLAEFCRRHLDPEPDGSGPSEPELEPAPGRQRRRARAVPPDFDAQVSAGKRYAATHARLSSPALVDIRRLEDGEAGLLFRGRWGREAAVVTNARGRILHDLHPMEFRALEETLTTNPQHRRTP